MGCAERDECLRQRDRRQADDIERFIRNLGAQVDWDRQCFRSRDCTEHTWDLRVLLPKLCIQRENMRRAKDYKGADDLRQQLATVGVQVDDKTKIFTLADGST